MSNNPYGSPKKMLIKSAQYGFVLQALIFIGAPASVQAEVNDAENDIEPVAQQFIKAFIDADLDGMQKYFADKVLFDGDPRFIGRKVLNNPTELTQRQLSDAYSRLFQHVGSDKWKSLLEKVKPTLVKSVSDGKPMKLAKQGDYVYDLHFREATKGKRAGLDEAVIFVFRKVGKKYQIVAHFADY